MFNSYTSASNPPFFLTWSFDPAPAPGALTIAVGELPKTSTGSVLWILYTPPIVPYVVDALSTHPSKNNLLCEIVFSLFNEVDVSGRRVFCEEGLVEAVVFQSEAD